MASRGDEGCLGSRFPRRLSIEVPHRQSLFNEFLLTGRLTPQHLNQRTQLRAHRAKQLSVSFEELDTPVRVPVQVDSIPDFERQREMNLSPDAPCAGVADLV